MVSRDLGKQVPWKMRPLPVWWFCVGAGGSERGWDCKNPEISTHEIWVKFLSGNPLWLKSLQILHSLHSPSPPLTQVPKGPWLLGRESSRTWNTVTSISMDESKEAEILLFCLDLLYFVDYAVTVVLIVSLCHPPLSTSHSLRPSPVFVPVHGSCLQVPWLLPFLYSTLYPHGYFVTTYLYS